jgi:hypothetical protein
MNNNTPILIALAISAPIASIAIVVGYWLLFGGGIELINQFTEITR